MRVSQSQILRNVLYKVYEWLNKTYRSNIDFDRFYQLEMERIINNYKNKI